MSELFLKELIHSLPIVIIRISFCTRFTQFIVRPRVLGFIVRMFYL